MRIIDRFRKFLILSARKKLLFCEALLLQLIAGLILKVVPFRIIPRIFALPPGLRPQVSPLISLDIKQAIILANRISPWKNRCLVQSLAARWMLNRRRIHSELSLGVTIGHNEKIIAHAWLKARDFEVIEKKGNYVELYLF
jgi:hypothetical protein